MIFKKILSSVSILANKFNDTAEDAENLPKNKRCSVKTYDFVSKL